MARVLVHAEKHYRGAEGSDVAGQVVDGVVIAEHHQIRFHLAIVGERLLGYLIELLGGTAFGIHVEVADVVVALEVGGQAGVVALIPQVFGVVAADHQNLGRPQPQREGTQQQ